MDNKKMKKTRLYLITSAAVIAFIFTLNIVGHFSKENMAFAIKQTGGNPQVKVPFDLKAEQWAQKSVDEGHSPWKLDPAFVSQVFVSLEIYPEGIQGDYPIRYGEFKVVKNNGKEAIVQVGGSKTPIRKVYLERLVRQDNTGIWTVVGYDPVK